MDRTGREHPGVELSLYLDGDLPDHERRRVEEHLSECERCREAAHDLADLSSRAARLPDRGPETDLWPAIARGMKAAGGSSRTAAGGGEGAASETSSVFRRELRLTLPRLAAAAALVAVMASGLTWSLVDGGDAGRAGSGPAGTREPVAARGLDTPEPGGAVEATLTVASVPRSLDELAARYRAARAELDPETRRMLDENLRLVDRALAEAREALARRPGDLYLRQHMTQVVRRKAKMLSVAVQMTAAD